MTIFISYIQVLHTSCLNFLVGDKSLGRDAPRVDDINFMFPASLTMMDQKLSFCLNMFWKIKKNSYRSTHSI